MVAGTQNYFLNHLWSFREYTGKTRVSVKKWLTFLSGSLLGLGINITVMYLLVNNCDLPFKFMAQACGIAAGMTVNFIIAKIFIFKKNKENPC